MKKILKVLLIVLIVIAVAFAGYFAYLMIQYSRIEDKLPLEVAQNASSGVNVGEEYSIATWNLGFGAYSDDYSFFMDGGTEIISTNLTTLIVGNVVAFIVALLAIKFFISFVTKYGFVAFGWYRIIVGSIILIMSFLGYNLELA